MTNMPIFEQFKNQKRPYLSIGEVEEYLRRKGCKISIQRIRRFEQWGMIEEAHRTERHFRCYGTEQVDRIHVVASLQNLEKTVKEIKYLMNIEDMKERFKVWSELIRDSKHNVHNIQSALWRVELETKQIKEAASAKPTN